MMHKIIVTDIFNFISLMILLGILAGFIAYRAAVTDKNNIILYSVFHGYCLLSSIAAWIFYAFYDRFLPIIDRDRRGNGEANCDPTIAIIVIALSLGLFSLPLIVFWNNNNRNDNFCKVIVISPGVCATIAWIILPIILDNDKSIGFAIYFWAYSLIYIYITIYSLLAFFRKQKLFIYLNPATWVFLCLSPPVFYVIQLWMKHPNSDIEELKKAGVIDFKSEDSDDSNFDDHGLEGFANIENNQDENIFEVFSLLIFLDLW